MLSQRLKEYRQQHPEDDEFQAVHLNYKSIRVVDRVPSSFAYIEELYLNHNNLATLAGIEAFLNIKIFHFRFNYVVDLQELKRISNPFFLKSLAVLGNQFENDPNCNKKWLKTHLFRNLEEYNPPSSRYYRQQDKSAPMNLHQRNQTLSLEEDELNTERALERNANNLSVSFSGKGGSGTLERTSGIRIKAKDISLMSHEADSGRKSQDETKRFTREVLKSTSPDISVPDRSHHRIRPFKHDDEEPDERDLSAETAKFSFNNRREQPKGVKGRRIAEAFVEEQTIYFADAFYYRTLCEKAFRALSALPASQQHPLHQQQLKLKALIAFKANRALCLLEREYGYKRQHLLQARRGWEPSSD